MTTDYSLSDIAAATGNGGNNNNGSGCGWGGYSWWVIILFFIFAWGWGGFGNGFGGRDGAGVGVNSPAGQGALTRGDLCMDMNFQEVKREIQNANDAVNLGFSNLNSTICNQQGQNAIQTQLAGCCCDLREAVTGVNYNLATQSCDTRNTIQNGIRDVIDNQNANARAVLDKLTQQELAAKDAQISSLNNQLFRADLAASQSAQNSYLINTLRPFPVASYTVCNPFTGSYGYANYNNCGCSCGCGCNG